MDADLENILYHEFADLFDRKNYWEGVTVGKGWYVILYTLCFKIKHHLKYHPEVPFVFTQIKEKFGCLRIYYDGGDEYIQGLVDYTEEISGTICEECGVPGKLRNTAWIKTLCDEHAKGRQ